jgi:MFS family permease
VIDQAVPAARPGYRRYGHVWSVRPVRWAFAGTLIARMAQTMMPLALLLVFRQRTGSFAVAGLAVAVFGLASVAGGPVTARVAGRRGRRVLASAGALNAVALVLLAVTASPAVAWIAVVAAGVSVPPLTSVLRATILARIVSERERGAAFALDAVATELLFVAGPALVSAAVALGAAADALIVAGGLVVTGSAFVAHATGDRSPPVPSPARGSGARRGAMLTPWLAVGTAQMAAIGFIEVAAAALAMKFGHPAAAGTVLALWAAGSVAGGLVYGSRDWPGPAAGQLRCLLLLAAVGFAVVAAAGSMTLLYPLMLVAGLACAPAATALTASFSAAVGAADQTESFAWLASASSLGGSAGYAAAGLLLTHAAIGVTIAVGAAFALAATAIVPRATRALRSYLITARSSSAHPSPPRNRCSAATPTYSTSAHPRHGLGKRRGPQWSRIFLAVISWDGYRCGYASSGRTHVGTRRDRRLHPSPGRCPVRGHHPPGSQALPR